jgi:hypothetical protein
VIVALAIHVIAEETQSRPDASTRPVETSILLEIDQRRPSPVLDTAAALWVACRPVLPVRNRPVARLRTVADNQVLLTLRPGIRTLTTRRLTGCLGDTLLSKVRADVVEVHHVGRS